MYWEIYDLISGDATGLSETIFGSFVCEILSVFATVFVVMLPFIVVFWLIKMVWGTDYDY